MRRGKRCSSHPSQGGQSGRRPSPTASPPSRQRAGGAQTPFQAAAACARRRRRSRRDRWSRQPPRRRAHTIQKAAALRAARSAHRAGPGLSTTPPTHRPLSLSLCLSPPRPRPARPRPTARSSAAWPRPRPAAPVGTAISPRRARSAPTPALGRPRHRCRAAAPSHRARRRPPWPRPGVRPPGMAFGRTQTVSGGAGGRVGCGAARAELSSRHLVRMRGLEARSGIASGDQAANGSTAATSALSVDITELFEPRAPFFLGRKKAYLTLSCCWCPAVL